MRALPINGETTMFTSVVPIPTVGNLAVNSYLIRGEQPTLIDTGITPEVPEFDVALREVLFEPQSRLLAAGPTSLGRRVESC